MKDITLRRLLLLLLAISGPASAAGPVRVDIFENSGDSILSVDGATLTASYDQSAFGFVRVPTRYSKNALPLDRSNPFVLRAVSRQSLPAGEYEFRLRSRGLADFSVDGSHLLQTKAQKGNTSGHDEVPPEVPRQGELRPLPYPHQEMVAILKLDGAAHEFVLLAQVGGKGVVPAPGELSVSLRPAGKDIAVLPRLLGEPGAPVLSDAAWEEFTQAQIAEQEKSDVVQRRALSASVAGEWEQYHKRVREVVAPRPAPKISSRLPVFNDVDRFVGARLEQEKISPTPLIGDLEFLRRVSLDAIGRAPTTEDIRLYLKDPPAGRRARAIERLLADPGWADHWVSYWQDVLAENPGILKPDLNNSGPFRWWLHQSFEDGIPFDRLVAELIQMEGSEYLGAPAAFKKAALNDAPMAAKADIISQAFLGEKLSCARCHDAPYHPWTQKNTFSLGAMLEGKALKLPLSSTVPLKEGFRKPKVTVSLQPGQMIEPEWPFQKLIAVSATEGSGPIPPAPVRSAVASRDAVARLVISPANKRFAQVLANRVWKRYLGAGLVDSAEDWNEAHPSNPELLDFLATEFVRSGYDFKALSRLIFSSHLYQRQPVPAVNRSAPEGKYFAGPIRRRISAEQLVDTLFQCAGKDFASEEMNLNPAGNRGLNEFLNLGTPHHSWEFAALMNERDRPALALPVAQSIVDVLTTFGWRQARQTPASEREDSPSPMQTLILANGIMGTRVTRLSDDSAFTTLALRARSSDELVEQTFLRVLTRPPSKSETLAAREFLASSFAARKTEGNLLQVKNNLKTDSRVTWGNHLSSEATVIRMDEEKRLRLGDAPTTSLAPDFRERYEDLIWSLVNSPEFTLVP